MTTAFVRIRRDDEQPDRRKRHLGRTALFVIRNGIFGLIVSSVVVALASCSETELSKYDVTATAEIRHGNLTATAEIRHSNRTATAEVRRGNLTATAASPPPPTRVPTPVPTRVQPSMSQVNRWTRDLIDISQWFTVSTESVQWCVILSDLDWDHYDARIADFNKRASAIAADVDDGSLDRHSIAEVEDMITDAKQVIREIGRECDIPVD